MAVVRRAVLDHMRNEEDRLRRLVEKYERELAFIQRAIELLEATIYSLDMLNGEQEAASRGSS